MSCDAQRCIERRALALTERDHAVARPLEYWVRRLGGETKGTTMIDKPEILSDEQMRRVALAAHEAQQPVAWRHKVRVNNEFYSGWILTQAEPPDGITVIAREPLYTKETP